MRNAILLMTAGAVSVGLLAAAGEKPPLKVVMLSGAFEYRSHETLPILKKRLEADLQATCTLLQARKRKGHDVPGMEALDDADVLVVFMRRQSLRADQLRRFKAWCEAGKPVVGIRTASHAVQTWLVFDKLVLGGNYRGHYRGGPDCKVTLTEAGKKHPILQGVEPFVSKGSLYKNTGLKATHVLMYGEIPDHREPVAWTHTYKGGRIFYTSLGHQADFQNPHFLRMLTNAVRWAAGRQPQPTP